VDLYIDNISFFKKHILKTNISENHLYGFYVRSHNRGFESRHAHSPY